MPSFASLAPTTPVDETQPVAPVEGAASAPVEQAPPPSYTPGSFGALAPENQGYTEAPAAPPSNYIPGSTYSPAPLADIAQQKAPTPPPAAPNQVAQNAMPTDIFSGIGDVAGSIGTNLQQGDLKSAAMNFLDAPGLANQNERNVVAQRAKDAALHGDPDYTTGNIGPSGFLENPGGILPNIGHALMTTTSEFSGMPDWVPSSTEEQSIEFYKNNPQAVQAAQEREKTEGISAWYNVWNEAQGNTLETGGLGGFASDAVRGAADPLNLGSAALGGVGEGAGQLFRNANMIGAARGTEAVFRGGEIALDPLFEGGSSLLAKGVKKVVPVFRNSDQVAGAIGNEKVVEAVATGVDDLRRSGTAPTGTTPGAVTSTLTGEVTPNDPVDPILPLPMGKNNTTFEQGGNLGPKRLEAGPPRTLYGEMVDGNPSAPLAAPEFPTNTKVVNEMTRTRQAAEASLSGDRKVVRTTDPATNRERFQLDDGSIPTVAQMEGMRKTLVGMDPNRFVPWQYGHPDSQNTGWLAMMTQEGYMYDGWSPSRIDAVKYRLKNEKMGTEERTLLRSRITAGERFNTYLTQRVTKHGDSEVQRVVDNIQAQADRDLARGIDPLQVTTNAESRLGVLAKAVEDSGRKQSFEVVVQGQPIRYYGDTNTFIRPRPVGMSSSVIPLENPLRASFDGHILGYPNPSDVRLGADLLNQMGVNPDAKAIAADPEFLTKFTRMVMDPEGFRHTGPKAREAIEQRRLAGDISDARAEQLLEYLDIRKKLYGVKAIAEKSGDNTQPIFREGNLQQENWTRMKSLNNRLTANWDDPFGAAPENPFDPAQLSAKLHAEGATTQELGMTEHGVLDADTLNERMDTPKDIGRAAKTNGVEVLQEADGSYGIYHNGTRVSTATTQATANVQARRMMEAMAEDPATRRITDIGEAPAMAEKPKAPETPMGRPVAKPLTPEEVVAKFPSLANKLDEAAAAKGKPTFTAEVRKNRWQQMRANGKAAGSRMRAYGDTDWKGYGDPELDASGMAEGMKAVMHQIDETKPLVVDGNKVPIYTYIKRTREELDGLPILAKSIDPKNTKAMRAFESIKDRYKKDVGEWDLLNLTDAEKDQLITTHVTRLWADTNLPKSAPDRYGIANDMGKMVKNAVDFRRGVGLTNWVAAPRQFLNQYFGNMWGVFMGKPTATIDLLNMNELRRYVAQLHGGIDAPNSLMQDVMYGYGAKAPNTMLAGKFQGDKIGTNTLAGHEVKVEGAIGKLRDFVAPKWLRDWVSGPDELAKGAVGGRVFRTEIRKEVDALPINARMTSARMASKRQGMEGITAQIERKLPQALEQFRTDKFNRPQFTGEQLEQAIKDIFEQDVKRGTINRDALNNYADRMKRDWNTTVNSVKQQAAAETKRVMFSWDNTRADDMIQNIFLYHYWATRAGYLYSKEMLKRPYLINLYMDAAEQIQAEAEKGDYPDWMKGFTRILNSPMGVALFMSPLDMISTAFHLNEMEMGQSDSGDGTLTALGQLKGMFPFVWNPAVELALTYAGAFGPGAAMPNNMTGMNRMTGFFADIINYANFNGMLGNIGKDAMGNPIPIAPRPFDDAILKVAGHFGMPVVPSSSSYEKETTYYLYDQLTAKYGLMDPIELNQMVDEMFQRAKQGDVDPMLRDAQADALANTMKGPELPDNGWGPSDWLPDGLPEALNPIFGAVARYVSPVRLTARSETGALMQYPGMANTLPSGNTSMLGKMADAGGDEYAIKQTKRSPYQTERARSLSVSYQDYYDGGNPALADLDDTYWAIGGNRYGQTLNVDGVDYTPADLNAMSDKERYNVANGWLMEQGYTRKDLDAMQAYKDKIITENPDVGGYVAFQNYVKNYPGGVQAFVDEAVKTSPSFAAYQAQQGQPGTPQYYEFSDTPDAYLAISGERSSVYGQENTPSQGYIPGLPMGTNFIVKYQTDKAIDDAASGGETSFKKFVNDTQGQVNAIFAAQEWLDQNYPGVQADGDIPYDVYKAMKAANVTAPKLEDAGAAYEYYTWLPNNAGAVDTSLEAFLDQRDSDGSGYVDWNDLPQPTPDMILQQQGIPKPPAVSPMSKEQLQQIGIAGTMAQWTYMRVSPSEQDVVSAELPAGMPMKEIYRGADGWSQVYVTTVGGSYQIGWVPTTSITS